MAKQQTSDVFLQQLLEDPRVTVRREGTPSEKGKCIVYWMQRAQRGIDNHAIDIAALAANLLGLPLVVYFAAVANFPSANLRHYVFLNQGLPDIEADLAERNIAFVIERSPYVSLEQFLTKVQASLLVGDENPLRGPERWRQQIAAKINIPFWTVDADVIVPSKLIEKAQYGAYTLRPRLNRLLPDFLRPFENLSVQHQWKRPQGIASESARDDIARGWKDLDRSVSPVAAWQGGTHAALKRLKLFVGHKLADYEKQRNHPELDGTSCLSPYLHFGHVGPLTIALAVNAEVKKHPHLKQTRDSFFNELIIWRELAINFVRYSADYDAPSCAEPWAKATIAEHARDERETIYTLSQLEGAQTHDELWNAAQLQMVHFGWMHNHMRMYWAKKVLEWTPDVAIAIKYAIHLNDKYFLDGRDPNGYAGIAWAILGKFDRAWNERPIFGKIRYMSAASTGKKFNSKQYIAQNYNYQEIAPPLRLR